MFLATLGRQPGGHPCQEPPYSSPAAFSQPQSWSPSSLQPPTSLQLVSCGPPLLDMPSLLVAVLAVAVLVAAQPRTQCGNCVDESVSDHNLNKWSMPIFKYKEKRYYLGIFFKANWFRASQYCRYHGMHLASISSQEENDKLEEAIKDFGYIYEHFWVSGTDLAEEGNFFWMSTGRPITFTNWNAGEPNNFKYENGEEENCLELWDRDGKGLKWNDSACSFETYFVCETVP